MNGDFKGDFTRDTFGALKGFSRVLMQQGRVQLDADWNEQADILLRLLRRLARDVIGTQGAPEANPGFNISTDANHPLDDFLIGAGEYYVDGILVENAGVDGAGNAISYKIQPYELQVEDPLQQNLFLVYLDVWERQVSFIEDDSIREVALGVTGPDTATRAQVVWQVKVISEADFDTDKINLTDIFNQLVQGTDRLQLITSITSRLRDPLRLHDSGTLRARAKVEASETTDVCIIPPDAQYRGAENQLYRVEIHNGGSAWPPATTSSSTRKVKSASGESPTGATFKWSRENGSVVFPIVDIGDKSVTLANLGRDDRSTLEVGDWVEIVDDAAVFEVFGNPDSQPYPDEPLLRVQFADRMTMEVTLSDNPQREIDLKRHPLLRRWDQKGRAVKKGEAADLFDKDSGTMKLVEGQGEIVDDQGNETGWITLEDGVQIQFQPGNPENPTIYRPGDYWLIPARVITRDVEWPREKDGKTHKLLPPHGVEHHLAPLAVVNPNASDNKVQDARFIFMSLVHLTYR